MTFYELQLKAQCDNIEKVYFPVDECAWFKFKCCRCCMENPNPIEIDPNEKSTGNQSNHPGANLFIRCQECNTSGNISVIEQKNQLTFHAQDVKFQTIMILDCRNVEPLSFHPIPSNFNVVTSESGAVIEAVDLTQGEWFEYDEKASQEISITDIEFNIVRSNKI